MPAPSLYPLQWRGLTGGAHFATDSPSLLLRTGLTRRLRQACALLARRGGASSSFPVLLPNGAKVPCPPGASGCTGAYCLGYGHTAGCVGGNSNTAVNAFGAAFRAAGDTYTVAFCKLDSDGDGQTNGRVGCCAHARARACARFARGTVRTPSGSDDVPFCFLGKSLGTRAACGRWGTPPCSRPCPTRPMRAYT